MRHTLQWLPLALMLAVSAACSRYPSDVMHPEELASLMADIHMSEAFVEQSPADFQGDSAKMALKQSVYRLHGVTSEQVDSTMAWYGRHMEIYIKVYEQVVDTLRARQHSAQSLVAASTGAKVVPLGEAKGDTVEIWPGHPVYELSERLGLQYMAVNMEPGADWEPGDNFELRFRLSRPVSPVGVAFGADYADGSHSLVSRTLIKEGMNSLTLRLDPEKKPTALYVSAGGAPFIQGHELVIDSISLLRIHPQSQGRK